MNNNNFEQLYYSQQNLDNTFKQVCEEISRRTNKDISKNSSYRKSFNQMAKMVYDKTPESNRNLALLNTKLNESTVTFFHKKMFEKDLNLVSTPKPIGFTMAPENKDIKNKYDQFMQDRQQLPNLGLGSGIRDNGNPNTYLPQPNIPSNNFVNNEKFLPNSNPEQPYVNQFNREVDKMQNTTPLNKSNDEFKIKPFNITQEFTESLMYNENEDSPLYQNVAALQAMNNSDPMSLLNDYQKQRNQQIETYIDTEARQNITAMNTQGVNTTNILYNKKNTDATTHINETIQDPTEMIKLNNKLTSNYIKRMEERIVNDNNIQTIDPNIVEQQQRDLTKLQRDTQPKYIEKVHYINISSLDRQWEENPENRFQFQVRFNQDSTYTGAGISQLFKNILSVELVNAILPFDESIEVFDTRLYLGITKHPYLLLRIDELDSVFRGTNNFADRAFSVLLYDKTFTTNVLSSEYITGASSIVNSTPTTTFTSEYMRGYHKYNPAYFEKKKFYNYPLASLNKMTITVTDPRGQYINTQSDVLTINTIVFTGALNTLTGLQLDVSNSFPNDASGATRKMVRINTTTSFSNRLFRIGDRVIIRDFTMDNSSANNSKFVNFINQEQGHIIINLDVELTAVGANQGFTSNIYISPPGVLNTNNNALDSTTYYDSGVSGITTAGVLINADLQSQLLFRIVTRDADTAGVLNPINVW
jgi:hypothetical protein